MFHGGVQTLIKTNKICFHKYPCMFFGMKIRAWCEKVFHLTLTISYPVTMPCIDLQMVESSLSMREVAGLHLPRDFSFLSSAEEVMTEKM